MISKFEWLDYTGYLHILPGNGRPAPWSFMEQTREFRIETRSQLVCREDYLAILTLVKNGAGVMQVYRFIVEDELKRGELIELLPGFAGTSRPFMIVYPYKRQVL